MDTINFLLARLVWIIISPDALLLLIALVGTASLYFQKLKLAKLLLSFSIVCFALIAFFPVNEWLASPLENRFETNPELPDKIDGIIVLGGSFDLRYSASWKQAELNDSSERLIAAAALAKTYPGAKLVFSGGIGGISARIITESDVAEIVFTDLGLPNNQVIYESSSRNTYENVINSKALVQPSTNENWILVTSGIHLPRAVGLFCQEGWSTIPYPVDHNSSPSQLLRVEFDFAENLMLFSKAFHEWLGLVAHRLSGKTSSLFPSSC